jgi:hypothetical protein
MKLPGSTLIPCRNQMTPATPKRLATIFSVILIIPPVPALRNKGHGKPWMQLKKYQFSGNFDWFVTGLAAQPNFHALHRIISRCPVTRPRGACLLLPSFNIDAYHEEPQARRLSRGATGKTPITRSHRQSDSSARKPRTSMAMER